MPRRLELTLVFRIDAPDERAIAEIVNGSLIKEFPLRSLYSGESKALTWKTADDIPRENVSLEVFRGSIVSEVEQADTEPTKLFAKTKPAGRQARR